jgi:hypothetical protein
MMNQHQRIGGRLARPLSKIDASLRRCFWQRELLACRPVYQSGSAQTVIDGVDVFAATRGNFNGCCLLIAD